MKKYLVTGGTGFIGATLVKQLTKGGNHVRVLDNNFRGAVSKLDPIADDIEFIEADIRSAESVNSVAKGMDSIIHLAFINGTKFFYSKPKLVLDVGIRGMLNVLDACRAQGIRELILASSSEVYQTPPKVPTDEAVPLTIPDVLNPRYSYAGGKLISELLALNFGRTDFERVIIFRPHNIYGPDMGWEHVLPQFILRALDAIEKHPLGTVPFPIQGDGIQTRAFCHIDDLIKGIMCILKKGEHQNIYNIGNPEELEIQEVARKVVAYFGRDAAVIPGKALPGSTQRRCPDISKLARLGFRPTISFDEGLPSIADWYRQNRKNIPLY
ncbi:MAG: NAD-dependent epimerase/dehydratase family protein [Promethearchaeota archaeon]|jgi:dTDP-glucose 4,6-dehydratase/UDP-glucose 4-epimerase